MTLLATAFSFDFISRSFGLVDKVGIEYVELIALHHFGWRVVMIVVRLIVFVPFVAHLHSVKVAWLSWAIFA